MHLLTFKNKQMKRLILLVALINITLISFGQRKNDILKEIQDYKKNIVRNASYDKPKSEVWNAMYIVVTQECNTIIKESESKGYIEAKDESDTRRGALNAEIRGDSQPYRISFQVTNLQTRSKNYVDGTYTDWVTVPVFDAYYTKLYTKVYEMLNGTLEISPELQKKVDDFNASQTKDRNKIVKGKDY